MAKLVNIAATVVAAGLLLVSPFVSVSQKPKGVVEGVVSKAPFQRSKEDGNFTLVSGYKDKEPALFVVWNRHDFEKIVKQFSLEQAILGCFLCGDQALDDYFSENALFLVFAGAKTRGQHNVEITGVELVEVDSLRSLNVKANFYSSYVLSEEGKKPRGRQVSPWAMVSVLKKDFYFPDNKSFEFRLLGTWNFEQYADILTETR